MSDPKSTLIEQLTAPYLGRQSAVISVLKSTEQERVEIYGNAHVEQFCAPEDIVFEIGSITKVFTALLLARLVEDGTIDPDRPIGDACSEFAGLPSWITPVSLATHRSGLPRLHVPIWKALVGGMGDVE